MVDTFRVKGRCPGAWQPMASGDGLIVRVRPRFAQLSGQQALALCEAARRWGSGTIDLTNRANLQLRGIREGDWRPLMSALAESHLVDDEPALEARRNLLVAPDWQPGDATHQATTLLLEQLGELPELPAKVGFAIDAGVQPVLADDSADLRIECAENGQWLVRADGHQRGTPVASPGAAVALLIRLAHWFVETGGHHSKRVRRHRCSLPSWAPESTLPAPPRPPLALGNCELAPSARAAVYGLPFGQVDARILEQLIKTSGVECVRVTPWRRLLIVGMAARVADGLVLDKQSPALNVDACPGAPHCEQATVGSRPLAMALASAIEGSLHLSACSKGCARRSPADVCIVGRQGRYDLIFGSTADGEPEVSGLTEAQVRHYFGVH